MSSQLTLIDDNDAPDWRLGEQTRQIGRRGLSEARAVLRRARRRSDDTDTPVRTAA